MSEKTTVVEILQRSDTYLSLRSEQAVNAALSELGWSTTQGPYYLDGKSGKLRELDIVAIGNWRRTLKTANLTARVNIFVEVKTNSDYHILCSGSTSAPFGFGANEHWIGYSDQAREKIQGQLAKFSVNGNASMDFVHRVEKIAFPRQTMRTSSLRIAPPPTTHCFSAFRETNGKTEKDLDNSVLWRATLALRSAVQSAQSELIHALAEDLEVDLEGARRRKESLHTATSTIELHSCRLHLYLPVVVIQSRIWSAESEELKELKWARMVQHGLYGDTRDWVDVVNFEHAQEYFSTQTEYLNREFKKVRAKRC